MAEKPFPFSVCKKCCADVDADNYYTKEETDEMFGDALGDIETALDGIIAIQNELMGVSE